MIISESRIVESCPEDESVLYPMIKPRTGRTRGSNQIGRLLPPKNADRNFKISVLYNRSQSQATGINLADTPIFSLEDGYLLFKILLKGKITCSILEGYTALHLCYSKIDVNRCKTS